MTSAGENNKIKLVLVTGPAGAGRTTATRALEDFGYEVIDNIPLTLLPRLLSGPPLDRPLALGIDGRNRDFDVAKLRDVAGVLRSAGEFDFSLLFLDCSPDVLLRRYSETRRKHPAAPEASPSVGIEAERQLLRPIRDDADILIDTSTYSPHDLRADIGRWFGADNFGALAVTVNSFSYKRGVPPGMDMVIDCRFLRNPHWAAELRALNGLDAPVAEHVMADERWPQFWRQLSEMVRFLLPGYAAEGKSYFNIAFGCTGGQHRSVMVADKVSKDLAQAGWQVSNEHLELERRAGGAQPDRSG